MENFSLSVIHPDPSWYHRERTLEDVIKKIKHWTEILDPTNKTYKNELEEVEAWRKLHLMKMMIFRAHGLGIFPSRFEGPMPE